MNLAEIFGWGTGGNTPSNELPEIFPLEFPQGEFIHTDVVNIFSKILTDVLDRTHGLTDDQISLLWDNCVQTDASDGLITLLAKAMTNKEELFVVYQAEVQVVRKATWEESEKIKADYLARRESTSGIYISFKNFNRADMIKLYSALEYCTIAGLNKSMNLSKAVQLKMNDLRGSVSLTDSVGVKAQAMEIAEALSRGRDILVDAKDMIETSVPDLTAVQASIDFINQKRSFYLGMPEAYINGKQTGGLGTTGENDTKATERGLKNYFLSIMKPVLEALFNVTVEYKSQDVTFIKTAVDVLKIFSLADESIVSLENKTLIMNKLLELPDDAKGDEPKQPLALPPAGPVPPKPPGVLNVPN